MYLSSLRIVTNKCEKLQIFFRAKARMEVKNER